MTNDEIIDEVIKELYPRWPLIISGLSLMVSVGQLNTCSNKSNTSERSDIPTKPIKEVQTKNDSSKYKLKIQNDSLVNNLKVEKN